ncbi:MAG: HAMP domain-containing histidine kinase [Campylobacterales bacterium]|nr:HAMP domain-containing histidine kinase [Campylobacterales bacterium]
MPAFGALVFLFSFVVYTLIEYHIYDDLETELTETAEIIIAQEDLTKNVRETRYKIPYKVDFEIHTELCVDYNGYKTNYIQGSDVNYLEIYYPINVNRNYFIVVKKDISDVTELLGTIKKIIVLLNILATLFIGVFSYLLSAILAKPISRLTKELSMMDETSLNKIDRDAVPLEFKSLAKSVNILINKIEGHINYQKELFIGLAHELKTPLAVIKTKNSVTLMKERAPEKYIETLKNNNKTVDEMNRMTSSILDIGRAEYAQFEPTKKINISNFLMEKAVDYKMLAENQGIKFENKILPYEIECYAGESLLNHIIQNFVQNAIKFTPESGTITIKNDYKGNSFSIQVIDEGCGIDEDIDPFAPFIRKGEKQGVGLGLFLAKNAANAMDAKISIENRKDRSGTIASVVLECEMTS